MIPQVKSIVDGALRIAELVVQFKTNQDEWRDLQFYVQNAVATVLHSLASIDGSQSEARVKLGRFQATLVRTVKRIEAKQRGPIAWRIFRFIDRPTMIAEIKKEVDDVVSLFKLESTIRMDITIEKIFELLQQNSKPQAPPTSLNSTLSKLRRIEGASWDPYRVCLERTRQSVIETILSWLNHTNGAEYDNRIFLLTGVAGSGKSAIAHTIAQRCEKNRQLASSFFFDRDIGDRNNPKHLISTIAADFCSADDQLARRILAAVEDDERVLHAPISRQFERFILEQCSDFQAQRPLVIVIDALDEGCNRDLLRILCDDTCRLPPSIRIFMTSRTSPDTESLLQKSHVRSMALDIYDKENLDDVAVFVPHELKQVAEYHGLTDWPDPHVIASFEAKAGGLFLWVATTCNYINSCYDPKEELHSLISASNLSRSSAEAMMDSLYIQILQACNWNDATFVDSFHRLLGAVVATKTPLTLRSLNALYRRPLMPSNLALRQLSTLLTGLIDDRDVPQPVRFLHQSLRDFLTLRAGTSSAPADSQIFSIDEKAHSKTLALLCLSLLNRELNSDMPCVGYLAKDKDECPGIPLTSEGDISEELWYACCFWLTHLLDVDLFGLPGVLEQLEVFIGTKLVLWMEFMAARGQYEGVSKLHEWAKDQCDHHPTLKPLIYNPNHAAASRGLAERFKYMGRREEALITARDEVGLYRELAEDGKHDSQAGLARSLCSLSIYLNNLAYLKDAITAAKEAVALQRQLRASGKGVSDADLARSLWRLAVGFTERGEYQEGLATIQESIALQRRLTNDGSATTLVMSDFAQSLRSLATTLFYLGHHEEAWRAAQQEVDIYRTLSTQRPAVFTGELARSLENISIDLSTLNHHREALAAIKESVNLRRQLAAERPAVFTPDLAASLHRLSYHLSGLGHHEEALTAIQEAVQHFRPLTADRPAVFSSDLAYSLHNLSHNLSSLGRHEEAFTAMRESVQLYRPLAADRPVVFTPDFALALHEMAHCLAALGDDQAALVAIKESVELLRPLAQQNPLKHTTKLSRALGLFAHCLSDTEADEEALVIQQELDALSPA